MTNTGQHSPLAQSALDMGAVQANGASEAGADQSNLPPSYQNNYQIRYHIGNGPNSVLFDGFGTYEEAMRHYLELDAIFTSPNAKLLAQPEQPPPVQLVAQQQPQEQQQPQQQQQQQPRAQQQQEQPQQQEEGAKGPACPKHPQSQWGMKESKFPEWDYYCTVKDPSGPKGYCVLKLKEGEFYIAPNVKWARVDLGNDAF